MKNFRVYIGIYSLLTLVSIITLLLSDKGSLLSIAGTVFTVITIGSFFLLLSLGVIAMIQLKRHTTTEVTFNIEDNEHSHDDN